MDFFKKAQNFLENAQNLLIHSENWKSQSIFSNNLNLHIEIYYFLAKSDHFEHFLKNSIFENFLSVLTHFVWEKIDFEIFNFLDESEDSEHFLKIPFLKIFTSVLIHFVWELD